jgi:arylsulfatase A-like enzyme
MSEDNGKLKRREFIAGLGAAATVGSALTQMGSRAEAQAPSVPTLVPSPDPPSAMVPVSWGGAPAAPAQQDDVPDALHNPNILVIIVDQMRQPQWLDSAHLPAWEASVPNILSIYNKAVTLNQYYGAATVCTPARACMMTGLYAPQTAMYVTSDTNPVVLDPRYPTWGNAIQNLNSAYSGNVWWFGKWHLSAYLGGDLSAYGFKTVTYPSANYPSPNGYANEGSDGGLFGCHPISYTFYDKTLASDAMIEQNFEGWLKGGPSGPWCATVSLINPHDINYFPYWLTLYTGGCQQPNSPGYGTAPYFNPPAPPPNSPSPFPFYAANAVPSPWNYESVNVWYKPPLQNLLVNALNTQFNNGNPLTYPGDYTTLLNYYYYLQSLVDAQVGNILSALAQYSPSNTVVVFTADHGEYGGSHSMRGKGGGVYDESIRVPLYVAIPGVKHNITRNQMCSAVDFFGLMCDLATGGTGTWRTAYPDLANRESIYNYIYQNSGESYRTVNILVNGATQTAPVPYVMHTVDEGSPGEFGNGPSYAELAAPNPVNNHIVCIRTKTTNGGNSGFKYAVYSNWASCTTTPSSNPQDFEYYDYQDSMANRGEVGNNYSLNSPLQPPGPNNDTNSKATLKSIQGALGTWGSPDGGTGVIGTELNATLVGTGTDGTSLRCVLLETARPAYFSYLGQTTCTVPSCT